MSVKQNWNKLWGCHSKVKTLCNACAAVDLNILSTLSCVFFCRGYPKFCYAEYIFLKKCFFYQLLVREMRKLLVVLHACCQKLGKLYVLLLPPFQNKWIFPFWIISKCMELSKSGTSYLFDFLYYFHIFSRSNQDSY
jgi:hypothetical protein